MNWAALIWFLLMVGFVIAEAACPFHLISVWFAAGALVATITALLQGPIWLQSTLFFVVSVALLVAHWPLSKKFLRPKVVPTNVDAMIGTEGYVTASVDNRNALGQVKLGGMEWTARSTTGEIIEAGTLVRVDRIEGVKAFVTPVREEVTV